MSTRSGKRIHNSFHENVLKTAIEDVSKSERKTRNKRTKENLEEVSENVFKGKKRNNYVTYPTDDELGADVTDAKDNEGEGTRILRKNALKERNTIASAEFAEPTDAKPSRLTRRTRKITDSHVDAAETINNETSPKINEQKPKKSKKKKKSDTSETNEKTEVLKKKSKKKKKGRQSGSMVVEDIIPTEQQNNIMNKSNTSIESFHSAAESPSYNYTGNNVTNVEEKVIAKMDTSDEELPKVAEVRKTRSGKQLVTTNDVIGSKRKRKSSLKDGPEQNSSKGSKKHKVNIEINGTEISFSNDVAETEEITEKNKDMDNTLTNLTTQNNTNMRQTRKSLADKSFTNNTADFTTDKRKSVSKDLTIDNITAVNEENNQSIKDATFEKESSFVDNKRKSVINTTFDKDESARKSSLKNTTFDKGNSKTEEINTTYDKVDLTDELKRKSLLINTSQNQLTIDKSTKLDATFDKTPKSSLISSDNSTITLDKSDVRISITSDESVENIVNMTPVLIESSLDESQIKLPEIDSTTPSKEKSKSPEQLNPQTPLKREGTFTKEEPEVSQILSSKTPTKEVPEIIPEQTEFVLQLRSSRTPVKQVSLPSPGNTPFPKSSSKEKTILNVTRSIEKSRRSSVADPQPRMTKVMFCSPVNNPAVVAQQKRKVIKSNLKGSNKSFVFDESTTKPRPAPRKRSYTVSDAEEAGVKRKRLADDGPHRLSRHRTSSAAGKLSDAKKQTPSKSKPEARVTRTKLPNFAALHQKQFDKMESLDECQERKAKRAKQLLTPTGSVNMLERISPKDTAPESKPKETPKKPETPIKSLPTLKSLNPGYTRFGFRLNLDVNPFSVITKTDAQKPKENKPNGLTRQGTLPSLTGATTARREVAKQTVMREKSFTDRRNVKRTENRTIIKGVRTNRRFELQMRMRNLD